MSKSRFKRGFTFGELLVLILILGIISAIAIPSFLANKKQHLAKATVASHGLCGAKLMAGISRKPLSDIERAYGNTTHADLHITPSGDEITWYVTGYEVTDMYGWQSNMKEPVHADRSQLQREGFTREGYVTVIPTTSKPVRVIRVELCLAPLSSREFHSKLSSS